MENLFDGDVETSSSLIKKRRERIFIIMQMLYKLEVTLKANQETVFLHPFLFQTVKASTRQRIQVFTDLLQMNGSRMPPSLPALSCV